jgi:hypothetical protein
VPKTGEKTGIIVNFGDMLLGSHEEKTNATE